MLTLIFYQIIITLSCLWSGILFYKFFPQKNESRPIIYYLITGLILLTSLTQIIVLFFPINVYTKFGLLGLLILLSIIKRKNTKFFIPEIKVSASLVLFFRSEEHTSELQSQSNLVCRLLLEKKKK